MGFFSELKSDLSQAVNTLMPEDKPEAAGPAPEVKEEIKPADISSMLNRLDDIKLDDLQPQQTEEEALKEAQEFIKSAKAEAFGEAEKIEEFDKSAEAALDSFDEPLADMVRGPVEESIRQDVAAAREEFVSEVIEPEKEMPDAIPESAVLERRIEEETLSEIAAPEPGSALEAISSANIDQYVADVNAETETTSRNGGMRTMDFDQQTPTDEVAIITEGMIIKGDLATTGSIDVIGKISGNIKCLGKLNITGEISGDSDAAEVYAESARITGEVKSKGSVKVGQSTVIVGNIFGSSAVIAGAVKGDIDVHGPVVLDTTAIVMGNIKSQSVQINNGAVIEGMCSQAYADVNPSEFFEGLKNR